MSQDTIFNPSSYFSIPWIDEVVLILFLTEQKEFESALNLINQLDANLDPRLVVAKAKCLIGLHKIPKALELLLDAEKKNWDLPQILLLKGKALFEIKEYNTAKMAFEKCLEINPTQEIKRWIQRCLVYLEADGPSRRVVRYEPQIGQAQDIKTPQNVLYPALQIMKPNKDKTPNAEAKKSEIKLAPAPSYEWYQNITHITMVIYIKDVKESELDLKFTENSVDVNVNLNPPTKIHIDLYKNIDPSKSNLSLTAKKIEIKMLKANRGQWNSFESHRGS